MRRAAPRAALQLPQPQAPAAHPAQVPVRKSLVSFTGVKYTGVLPLSASLGLLMGAVPALLDTLCAWACLLVNQGMLCSSSG